MLGRNINPGAFIKFARNAASQTLDVSIKSFKSPLIASDSQADNQPNTPFSTVHLSVPSTLYMPIDTWSSLVVSFENTRR